MKVIVSDPISDDGLKIFYDNNIDVLMLLIPPLMKTTNIYQRQMLG